MTMASRWCSGPHPGPWGFKFPSPMLVAEKAVIARSRRLWQVIPRSQQPNPKLRSEHNDVFAQSMERRSGPGSYRIYPALGISGVGFGSPLHSPRRPHQEHLDLDERHAYERSNLQQLVAVGHAGTLAVVAGTPRERQFETGDRPQRANQRFKHRRRVAVRLT